MSQFIRRIWLTTSLKRKLGIYTAVIVLVMGLSAAFNTNLMEYALDSFSVIQNDNSRCHEVQTALSAEMAAFESYVRTRTQVSYENYLAAAENVRYSLDRLPLNYRQIGEDRFARTWNLKNAYEGYVRARDLLLQMDIESSGYVPSLYQVYGMQEYLQTYAQRLMQATMLDGDRKYQFNKAFYQNIPILIVLISATLAAVAVFLNSVLARAWLEPIRKLIQSTKKISANDYSGEDIRVDNQDEMGELVRAFNKMKFTTAGYIQSLMDNYEMSERLHKEELERLRTERMLDDTRLELLKSQINPHFLFNTLNTISCMAQLEDADTTGKMITSLSNLFRYNLKTTEQIVPLAQELKVVQDYIYIQQMRFGGRIRYRMDIQVDEDDTMIPAFTLQPLVENAYIHGVSKKEEGGAIVIRSWKEEDRLILSVADTGLGITPERLVQIEDALEKKGSGRIGIGVGNIYRRIRSIYPDGTFQIISRSGHGTVIRIEIPHRNSAGSIGAIMINAHTVRGDR